MKKLSLITIVLLLGATMAITACGSQNGEEPVAMAAPPEEEVENVTPVEVATVEKGTIALIYAYAAVDLGCGKRHPAVELGPAIPPSLPVHHPAPAP